MKKYSGILILTLSSIIVLSLVVYRGLTVLNSDADYQKMFDPDYESMIIGCSPIELLNVDLIARSLNNNHAKYAPIGNFAFDLTLSRYGPLYSKKIARKLSSDSDKERVFILSITPWNVSADQEKPNDTTLFVENNKLMSFNDSAPFPRVRYFFNYYTKPYYTLFFPVRTNEKSDEIPSAKTIEKFQAAKIGFYRKNYIPQKISEKRYQSFESLITYLKEKGKVYVIRMPVSDPMIKLEAEYEPEFDKRVDKTIQNLNVDLIDFLPYSNKFLCPDGNHLIKDDADKVSLLLGDIIRLTKSSTSDSLNLINEYLNSDEALYRSFLVD